MPGAKVQVLDDGRWAMAQLVTVLRRHAWWVVLWTVASSIVWLRLFLLWRKTAGGWLLRQERRLDQRYG